MHDILHISSFCQPQNLFFYQALNVQKLRTLLDILLCSFLTQVWRWPWHCCGWFRAANTCTLWSWSGRSHAHQRGRYGVGQRIRIMFSEGQAQLYTMRNEDIRKSCFYCFIHCYWRIVIRFSVTSEFTQIDFLFCYEFVTNFFLKTKWPSLAYVLFFPLSVIQLFGVCNLLSVCLWALFLGLIIIIIHFPLCECNTFPLTFFLFVCECFEMQLFLCLQRGRKWGLFSMYSTIWTVCILALFDIGIFLLKNVLICVPLETFETNFSGLYMTACFFLQK